ncbi:hypothetical protein [Halorientalis sp.]|jgi:uncharacterized protein YhfF|uniref:hypothetical protein n=1 Tax=Halorientalis sp. TaxID=1931229 RepID=UPI002611E346|nr:hypothetical protein [Halorientalis sp.]
MLSLQLDQFMLELKDGSIKNVGPANKDATAKLYDVEDVDVREFGDKRVKLAFEDGEGNEVEVALFPDEVREVARGVEMLEAESDVFE